MEYYILTYKSIYRHADTFIMDKPRKKRFLSGSYESEIKISLILLIGLLLSLNFFSAYSLGRARVAQYGGFNSQMKLALFSIRKSIELNDLRLPDRVYLYYITNITGVDKIEINDSLGSQLISVSSSPIKPDDDPTVNTALVRSDDGRVAYQIVVSGINREGARLERLALFDKIFRVSGLIVSLLVAFFFIRSVMNPYRKIKKEASRLNLPQVDFDDTDGVEYAVRLFQEVIRELKQKENLLQEMYDNSEKRADSLARYNEYILGSISSGVIICDNQGIITRFNRAAEKIIGFGQNHSQGKNYNEVFGKKHHISKIMRKALKNNEIFSRKEFEIIRENGDKLWIGLSSSLISDNENNKIGAAVLLTDLTKIKKLQGISDFTEKMAALGEMSAGLAHEFRNSMAAIIGFAKLLSKQLPPEDKATSIARMIISESLATEEMLSRFLNFAKPLYFIPTKINIKQILEESVSIAIEIHDDKSIDVVIDDKSDEAPVNGDPMLLKNALGNLINNAYQAMDKTGTLIINVIRDDRLDQLIITISDTGNGIPQENLPKIFNPFFTTKEKGTGLGLALVRKIITGHGGNIEVESKVEAGTTFTISLPIDFEIDNNNVTIDEKAEVNDRKSTVIK